MNKQVKPWDKKKNESYKIDKFETNKSILIMCEGQTEKEYFQSFDVINVKTICIDCKGLSKLSLIKECKNKVEQLKNKKIKFEEVWCVFDMDVKRGKSELSDFDNAIKSGHDNGFKIAYSNDAFELWFYLHYEYTDQQNHRKFYYEKLSGFFGYNYVRVGKSLNKCKENYSRLLSDPIADQNKAIDRAKKLHSEQEGLIYSKQNPLTTVYILVQNLNKYLRGSKRS